MGQNPIGRKLMLDVILRGGTVVDGTGRPAFVADLGVKDGRIVRVGNLADQDAETVLDCVGLHLLPGFIDTHVHSDMALLHDRQHANGLHQGITTEILGQDGLSYAPLSQENLETYAFFNRGLNGYYSDVKLDFRSVSEYLARMDGSVGVNVAYNVPHGTVRLEALGFHDAPLTGYPLEKAKALLREAFDQGAVGFSTGLSYYPQSFSDTKEMVELCSVAAEYDAPLVIHLRTVPHVGVELPAVQEALEIGRRSGCAVHFSHFRTAPGSAGRTQSLVAPLEEAIAHGQRVTAECYPYYSGSGYPMVCLPPWANEGGPKAILARLADPKLRPALERGMRNNAAKAEGTFTHVPSHPEYVGRDFRDVAREEGKTVEGLICDLLLENQLDVGYFSNPDGTPEQKAQVDRDLVWLLSRPYYMCGSDAIPYGRKPHPRAFGTFPRFFRLARENGMSVENFAYHTSQLPAKTFGLKDRGILTEGAFADIVALDYVQTTDQSTYEQGRRPPKGIQYVLVNGQLAVDEGKVNGILNGRALRREK